MGKIDHSVRALTRVRVAWIPRAELQGRAGVSITGLARAHRRRGRVGRREPYFARGWSIWARDRRTNAWRFCFANWRSGWRTTPSRPRALTLPLTQQMLAHALGLTPVHVNRVLRRLRGDGLLELQDGVLTIHDPVRTRTSGRLQ